MVQLDDKLLEEIQHELEGTCESLDAIIERHDLDISADELEDRLLDGSHAIERSGCCQWWFVVSELEDDNGRGVCAQCEPDAF